MALITFEDKVSLNPQPSVADKNKVKDSDMNMIKNAVNSATTYSKTEQIVGEWIDGKPLYRKVIETTTPADTNVGVIGTLSNIDTITNIYGMLKYGTQQVPLTLAYNTSVLNAILIEGNNINCKVSANAYTNCSCFVVVEYTKS